MNLIRQRACGSWYRISRWDGWENFWEKKTEVQGSGFKGSGQVEVSGVGFQVSGRVEVSGVGCQVSGRMEVSGVRMVGGG
jgi:hypothetical protein